jgi:hypothetical protein
MKNIACNPAKIRTGYFSNTYLQRYRAPAIPKRKTWNKKIRQPTRFEAGHVLNTATTRSPVPEVLRNTAEPVQRKLAVGQVLCQYGYFRMTSDTASATGINKFGAHTEAIYSTSFWWH